jgi:hypothetical protein
MNGVFAPGSAATAASVAAAPATATWKSEEEETKVVATAAILPKARQTAQGQRQGRVPSVASDSSDAEDDTEDCEEEEEEEEDGGAASSPAIPIKRAAVALEVLRTTAFTTTTTTKVAPAVKGQRSQRISKKTAAAAAAAAAEEEEEEEDNQTLEASESTAATTRLDAIHIADPADDTRTLLIGHLYGIGGRVSLHSWRQEGGREREREMPMRKDARRCDLVHDLLPLLPRRRLPPPMCRLRPRLTPPSSLLPPLRRHRRFSSVGTARRPFPAKARLVTIHV